MKIKGETIINHNIRVTLGLSTMEYCFLMMIHDFKGKISPEIAYEQLGLKEYDFMVSSLKDKNLISMDMKGIYSVANGFLHFFKKPDEDKFEELWKLHPKGNKTEARLRFWKVSKKVSFEELKEKLIPYIASNEFQFLKGLNVWLSPVKEHWNDPIVVNEKFKTKAIENKPIAIVTNSTIKYD